MPKIVVGPIDKGLRTDRLPFNIDNDSFPTLVNAYQWRGRIKRKRGNAFLGILQREITITSGSSVTLINGWSNLLGQVVFGTQKLSPNSIFITNITNATNAVVTYTSVVGIDYIIGQLVYIQAVVGMTQINNGYYTILNKVGNQLTLNVNSTGFGIYTPGTGIISLVNGPSIVPGSINLTDNLGNVYTEPVIPDGTLLANGSPSAHTIIHYPSGIILLMGLAPPASYFGTFSYYPNLPVMGLEDFVISPGNISTVAFDTTYAYSLLDNFPTTIDDVSFYKGPSTGFYPGYIQKAALTPLTWNGENYQQFYSVNYQGALWVTNGIDNPFTGKTIGMQFAPKGTITYVSNTATTLVVTITNCPLIVGDFVFLNEWTGANNATLNFQTGFVSAAAPNTPPLATKTITITFINTTLGAGPYTPGIIQYLTNRSNTAVDNIRWYDGDPTGSSGLGWVNFMPPLSENITTIADLPAAIYYLVGCRLIVPFKDRLLFMGVVVQTSVANALPIYLQDTIVYSQNGTPYYTVSFSGDPASIETNFTPILVPINQTATPGAYWSDSVGFGGFITAGIDLPITTSGPNQDALIIGFDPSISTKLVYTGNDLLPFGFFSVNSELGTSGTFSTIILDSGVLNYGKRGFTISNQTTASRIDLPILDQVFQINLDSDINGNFRMTAQPDFINEWVYFSYPSNESAMNFDGTENPFNSQTLLFNYRDNSWAIFNESFTTYGQFRVGLGWTWATIGGIYPTWAEWNDPWNAGLATAGQPQIIAGNQQGYIFLKDSKGTQEPPSLIIEAISIQTIGSVTYTTIYSPFHTLNEGDFIIITGAIGTIGPFINNIIFQISQPSQNSFLLAGDQIPSDSIYLGLGVITRMYVPFVQSKQFPVSWEFGRKTRIGPMQFLLNSTDAAQITLLVFLSQNTIGSPMQSNSIDNNALIYSNVLFTCPESTNLGLTPFNSNLQQANYNNQQQIWHRINTSLIGDTVQVGFWLSDDQMMAVDDSGNPISQFAEIEIHAFILEVNPSQMLS